jgi:hypothetical protein
LYVTLPLQGADGRAGFYDALEVASKARDTRHGDPRCPPAAYAHAHDDRANLYSEITDKIIAMHQPRVAGPVGWELIVAVDDFPAPTSFSVDPSTGVGELPFKAAVRERRDAKTVIGE